MTLIRILAALAFGFVYAAGSLLAQDQGIDVESISEDELALIRAVEQQRVQVIENVIGSVIAIYGQNERGGGSGVIIDPSGLALTNHHVIQGAGLKGKGGLSDGKLYDWDLIGTDPGGDVAVIKMKGRDAFPYTPLGDSSNVRIGDWAIAMGNPFLLAHDQVPTVTLGIVSGVERFQGGSSNQLVYGNCIQIDSSINPGNSGGPLFSFNSEVIGINGRGSFRDRGRVNVGLGYAISSNQIKNFLPDLLATKIVEHGTLDASFSERDGRVVCSTINLDAPVAQAGLELGDRLIEFEGQPIRYANQFKNLICTLPEDWPAHLVVEKENGEQLSLTVRMFGLPYNFEADEPQDDKDPEPGKEKDAEDKDSDNKDDEDSKRDEKSDQDKERADKERADKERADKERADKEGADKEDAEKDAGKPDDAKPDDAKPDDAKPDDAKPDDAKPDDKDKPRSPPRGPQPPRPGRSPAQRALKAYLASEPGVVLDEPTNRKNLKRILDNWRADVVADNRFEEPRVIRIDDAIWEQDTQVGNQTIWLATDGRFRIEQTLDGGQQVFGWDGNQFWQKKNDLREAIRLIEAKTNPTVSQVMCLAGPLMTTPFQTFGQAILDGGDKAQGQLAYRVMFLDEREDWFFCWLSCYDQDGKSKVRLLKASSDKNCETKSRGYILNDWRDETGINLPYEKSQVAGLSEDIQWTAKTTGCRWLDQWDEDLFAIRPVTNGESN